MDWLRKLETDFTVFLSVQVIPLACVVQSHATLEPAISMRGTASFVSLSRPFFESPTCSLSYILARCWHKPLEACRDFGHNARATGVVPTVHCFNPPHSPGGPLDFALAPLS